VVIIDDIEQRSPEWLKLKAGIPSASEFSRIITTKGELSKQRQDYIYELAGERIIKTKESTYQSFDMQRGVEREDEARECYEFVINNFVIYEICLKSLLL